MRLPLAVDRWAGRARADLREDAWSSLRTLRSLLGTGPVVGLPAVRRALVLAPHPDDETLGCGGTAALLAASGCQVTVVVATDGAATPGTGLPPAETARRRAAEVALACRVLGLPPPVLLGLPDGALADHADALTRHLVRALHHGDAQLVLAPWAGDGHADHRAALAALLRAVEQAPGRPPEVWGYETWTPLPWPDRVVDTSTVAPAVAAAAACHATAAASMDLEAMLALKRYRSLAGLAGRGSAEAFLAVTAEEHNRLLGSLAPRARKGQPA